PKERLVDFAGVPAPRQTRSAMARPRWSKPRLRKRSVRSEGAPRFPGRFHFAVSAPHRPCIGHRTGYSLHDNARVSGLASADFEGVFTHSYKRCRPRLFYERCARNQVGNSMLLALPKGLLNRRCPFLSDGSFEFEKMVAPRVELDEESCRAELIPVTDVAFPVQRFHQAPDAAAQVVPRKLHHRLRTVIGEVHHHQSPFDPQPPTPSNNVVKARIVGPAVALAQMPFAVVEKIGMGRAQQAAVKRNEGVIARLQRAAGQEHRKLDFTALDLPVID